MSNMLSARVAIVTGASRGIGRAIAVELARDGHNVLVNYHRAEQAAYESAAMVRAAGGEALVYRADVTQREQVRAMLRAILQHYGRLDVLVNNAGLLDQKPFQEISDNDWRQLLEANLNSVFVCTQEAAEYLTEGGSIVNISSLGGQIGGPKAPHYAAAKGAVLTFTKSSARLLASRGIRVNAVAPGYIRTDMFKHMLQRGGVAEEEICRAIPVHRLGEPSDVASAVAFLVSPRAAYITGQVLNLNGGIWMS